MSSRRRSSFLGVLTFIIRHQVRIVAIKSAAPFACCMFVELSAATVDSLKVRSARFIFCRSILNGSSALKDKVGAIFNSLFCSASRNSRNALNDAVRIGLESLLFRSGKYMHFPMFRCFSQLFFIDFSTCTVSKKIVAEMDQLDADTQCLP